LCSGGLRLVTFVARGLLAELDVLDDMLGRLHHDVTALVEALAPGAAGDLVEVAGAEDGRLPAVELAEAREQHRADGHVDADAERVGAADDLQEALLRQLLHEHAVLGQQARVVQADAVPEPLADLGAVRAREPELGDGVRDGGFLVLRADLQAGEVLGATGRIGLREVDDVGRRLAFVGELLEGVGERDLGVGEVERHRPV
jgi:hypothetical protein